MSEYCKECDEPFTPRYVARDGQVPEHVEIRDTDGTVITGAEANADMVGIVASREEWGLLSRGEFSSFGARAILLAESTKLHNNTLIKEAEELLSGPEDELLADEQEIAKLLGMKKPSWETLDTNRIQAKGLREVTIRRLCELRGVEVPSMDSPEYFVMVETADTIQEQVHEFWRQHGMPV